MKFNRRQTLGLLAAGGLSAVAGCQDSQSARSPNSTELVDMDAIAQVELVKSGQMSARELVQAAITRIEALDDQIGAFTDFRPENALMKAEQVDISKPLAGLPYALKDLNEYPGMKLERGTAMFKGNMGEKRSKYTQKIDNTGAIILGKTATPEFGLLGTTEPLAMKACKNPWNLGHSAGGSSGGAAAAVAARMIPMAQASDGGGSIRNPAAQCGLYGLKPSRGRFPDQGNPKRDIEISIKHAVSLSVRDNALMLSLTERQNGGLNPIGFISGPSQGRKRIAVTVNSIMGAAPHPDIAKAVEDAARLLEEMGHDVVFVDNGPGLSKGLFDDFVVLWGQSVVPIVEMAERMGNASPRQSGLLEGWTLDLADKYRALDAEFIDDAMKRLKDSGTNLRQWLKGYDAWLTPSAAMPAPALGWTRGDLPYEQNLARSSELVAHFAIHNVAGTPAASIPFGFSNGLPIAVQISAALGREDTILDLSFQIEQARPWMGKKPPLLA